MTKTISLGRHKITIIFNRKLSRPRKTIFQKFQKSLTQLKKLAQDKRYSGHPVSRILRKILENTNTKKILGINLVAVTLISGVATSDQSLFASISETEITTLSSSVIQLTTEDSIRYPVDSRKITQGYRLYHPAIDLAETLGSPVYPIMDGKVEFVAYQRFGYGNHLVIDHGSGFKSLYAHLGKIFVKKDDEVDKETVLGTIGATGWSTGPHLHLETHDNGCPFNPLLSIIFSI